jgi:hypothetical protein
LQNNNDARLILNHIPTRSPLHSTCRQIELQAWKYERAGMPQVKGKRPEEYDMTTGPGREMAQTAQRSSDAKTRPYLSSFPMTSALENDDQIRRFELLRLAFFVLKLRKLEQHLSSIIEEEHFEIELLTYRCSLLRHVIFQQVLTLIKLDARDQALQIITACQK